MGLNENNREIAMILNRLTQLTLSDDDEDDGEFDIASDTESDEIKEDENEQRLSDDNNMMQMEHRQIEQTQMNESDDYTVNNTTRKTKLKQKSIVHKVSKFMLSVLMVGAPLFYYYVH